MNLLDPDAPEHRDEFDRLHDSLIALGSPRAGPSIPTMGVAAASKILHVLVPPLFVMWDKEIAKGLQYGDFQLRMHELALRIRDRLAPPNARTDLEAPANRPRLPPPQAAHQVPRRKQLVGGLALDVTGRYSTHAGAVKSSPCLRRVSWSGRLSNVDSCRSRHAYGG